MQVRTIDWQNPTGMHNISKFVLLISVFASALVVSNVLATKLWAWNLLGFLIIVPAGVVAYPITFLMTDVIGEVWGKKITNTAVAAGFICALIVLGLGWVAAMLPPAPYFSAEQQKFFSQMFASMGRITFGSLFAYLVSQYSDVHIFHYIRDKMNGQHLWIRNNVATIISQFFDTTIFIITVFWGRVPNSVLAQMIIAQWFVKILLALADTPFCYVLVAWANSGKEQRR